MNTYNYKIEKHLEKLSKLLFRSQGNNNSGLFINNKFIVVVGILALLTSSVLQINFDSVSFAFTALFIILLSIYISFEYKIVWGFLSSIVFTIYSIILGLYINPDISLKNDNLQHSFALSIILTTISVSIGLLRSHIEHVWNKELLLRKKLEETKNEYRAIFKETPLAIQVFNPRGKVIKVNKSWIKLWGLNFNQIKSYNILNDKSLKKSGIIPYFNEAYNGSNVQIPPLFYEAKSKEFKGNSCWVKVFINPIKDAKEKLKEIIVIYEDISKQKLVEDELERSRKELQAIVDYSPSGIYSKNLKGRYTLINQSLADRFKLKKDELIDKTAKHLFSKDVATRLDEEDKLVFHSGKPMEFVNNINIDGKSKHYLINKFPLFDQKGKIFGISGIITDITKQKRTEELLEKSNNQLQSMVDNSPASVFIKDLDGRFVLVNKVFAQRHNKDIKSIIGKTSFDLYSAKDAHKLVSVDNRVKRYKKPIEEEEYLMNNNELRCFITLKFPLINNDGTLLGIGGISTDITERKIAEQKKDDLISIASHELKNPVATIKGYTQVLQSYFLKDDEASKYVTKMDDRIDRVIRLVNDLLDVSRFKTGKMNIIKERVFIDELVEEVIEDIQQNNKTIHKIIQKIDSKSFVLIDKQRIRQVLFNLLSNAIKYSPNSKKIILKTTRIKNSVVISVQDFGIGIKKENIKKVFEPFFQAGVNNKTESAGLGLGLHIASQIINVHKGRIWVKSEFGKGATFYFSIPSVP